VTHRFARTLVVIAALATTAATAAAQEQATVLKRDGTRVTGRFEAWNRNNNALYIRVSLGDQRIIPLGDTAMFEVDGDARTLPANELEAARGGDHVLVLRSGEILRGRLLNIEGCQGSGKDEEPRILSFKPNDAGERRARFNEVRRFYVGNFPSALAPTAPVPSPTTPAPPEAPAGPGQVRVAANQRWVATGLMVRRTDQVAFTTEGQVQLSGDGEDKAGPAGSLKGRYAGGSPAPSLLAGALIARIGNGPAFAIGDQTQPLPMPGEGQLFLAVNDDEVSDNQGSFLVTMRVTRRR
jgi:hypothetical protein